MAEAVCEGEGVEDGGGGGEGEGGGEEGGGWRGWGGRIVRAMDFGIGGGAESGLLGGSDGDAVYRTSGRHEDTKQPTTSS